MAYEHTQRGRMFVIPAACVAAVLVVVAVLSGEPAPIVAAVVCSLVVVIVAVFSRLTVTVGGDAVLATFGTGWPRRAVAVGDIVDVRPVRNRWFYGWGIRKIPRGWMYNVWGLDAVELELESGKVFRIGTDQPAELAAAISAERSG